MACSAQENQQGFRCTTSGLCYACGSAAADGLFKKLQAAINQFAAALIFTPIKVDGIIGPGTTTHAKLVLSQISLPQAAAINAQLMSPEHLAANAQVVVDALTLAAKQMNQPAAQPIPPAVPTPSATTIATTPAKKPPSSTSPQIQEQIKLIQANNPKLAASLLDSMPPWAAYVGGAALAVGALAAVVYATKRRGSATAQSAQAAVAGFFRR